MSDGAMALCTGIPELPAPLYVLLLVLVVLLLFEFWLF
jgi:hypothetical protein